MAVVVSVLAFAAWQLVMPEEFDSVRGLNPRAVMVWRGWWGLNPRLPPVAPEFYRAVFRALLVGAWAAYAGLLWFVARGARLGRGWTWPLAIPLAALLAVAMPASLSTDVFAYVGYGRLGVVHGLNPHLFTQGDLVRLGDPTAPYLSWPIASPYGPLWTMFSLGVVFVGRLLSISTGATATVLGPVIAFKVAAGAGLLAAAAAARALARRSDPRRTHAVFALVALNPLLLLEGPGNGHNDLVMVALFLAGVAAVAAGQQHRAALLAGVSAAVKLVPLVAVPWLAILAVRAGHARARVALPAAAAAGVPATVVAEVPAGAAARIAAVAGAVLTVGLALAPVIAAYAPFWAGPRTLGGIVARWQKGDPSGKGDGAAGTGHATGHAVREQQKETPWTARIDPVFKRVLRASPALLVYLWAMLAIALGQGDGANRLLSVWSFVALAILCFAAGMWLSWYLAWVWPALVVRFTRPHRYLMVFSLPFSLLLMLAYATPPG